MANKDQIQTIENVVEKSKERTGFNKVQKRQEKIRESKDFYSESRQEVKDLLYQLINQRVEKKKGRATLDERYTVKDGNVSRYGSSSSARIGSLRDNIDLIKEATDEEVVEFLERVPEKFSDIDIEAKTLITEEGYEYDAVTMKISGYSAGIRLVDTLGSKGVCGGDKVNFDKCCLDEITRIMKYLPFMKEIMEDAENKVDERLEDMEDLKEDLEQVIE